MKMFKSMLVAFAAIALVSTASAQTTIRVTGSSAFRSATHTAIRNILLPGYTFGFIGSTIGGANQAIFTGQANVAGSPAVIIKTSWSGSVAGIQTVSQNINVNCLPNTTPQSVAGTSGASAGTEAGIPDIAMADNFQGSCPFKTPVLTDKLVGVVGFQFVANAGAPAALNNVTPQLAQALYSSGQMSLALFTGSAADETITVNSVGRDPDSGTRLTAFAETGVGVESIVTQFQPTISGATVTNQIPWPASTINGIPVVEGNGGYASGSGLVTLASKTSLTGIGGYYVTYMGTSDAASAVTGGGKTLTYNGIPYSVANVQNGFYTFWCYEHLMYRSGTTGTVKTVADKLALQIDTVDAPILRTSMRVSRSADGGLITQLY